MSFPNDLLPQWKEKLLAEMKQPYFKELVRFLIEEKKQGKTIFPPSDLVMRVFKLLDYEKVRVVILGQDPYHGRGQAIGLSFAVPNSLQPKPPSLQNIFKELQSDLKLSRFDSTKSDLTGWVRQGVFLLNTVLTVRESQPSSHHAHGWENFTDRVISLLNERAKPIVFILWGGQAQKKKGLISSPQHSIIVSAHPSPLSAYRGFFGSRPFSQVNEFLKKNGGAPIDWSQITDESL